MHFPSNRHIGSEDISLGKPLPIPWFLEMPFHFLEVPTIMYISLAQSLHPIPKNA
jgi:hypothetical protein